jgi:polar amino acid transport system substrate-binding protein
MNMFKKTLKSAVLATATLGLFLGSNLVSADVIDEIKARGTLIVGTKADYKPYGFRSPTGAIIGIEAELAQDVADKLGVELELVPVVSSNRMQFLEQGKIDLMIATMTDREDRRKLVYMSDPNYYSSGTNVLAWKKVGLKQWEDLKGRSVCGIQGAFYNKKTAQEFGAKISAFKGTAEALSALSQGSCIAFVYDDSFVAAKLQDSNWSDTFEMPLATMDDAPWGLAVGLGEEKFHNLMNDMVVNWHQSGRILDLETKYGLTNTPFALRMHEELK